MIRLLSTFAFAALLVGSEAQAASTSFDFKTLGTFSTTELTLSALNVTADDGTGAGLVNALNLNGLGVVGGFGNHTVDGSEALTFAFTGSPASGVRYFVGSASNLNGNGTVGDATVEAFDANGASLGIVAVSGSGSRELTKLFGAVLISKFRVRASGDGLVISNLDYNQPTSRVESFTNLGTLTSAHVSVDELTVTADDGTNPATINVLDLNGLGVVGGVFSTTLDSSEALTFDFGTFKVSALSYTVGSAGNLNGNGTAGDAFLTAFDEFGASLGTLAVDGSGTHDLTTLFGSFRFSKFVVRANGDNQVITTVSYQLEPIAQNVDFAALSSTTTDVLSTGGIVAHAGDGAPAQLVVTNGVGLGVAGGLSNATIDGSETATFYCKDSAMTDVRYFVSAAGDQNGNAVDGDSFVEAFGVNGELLGSIPVSGAGFHDVSALFGNSLFSAFRVIANVDRLTISKLTFSREPGHFEFPVYGTGCPGSGAVTPRFLVGGYAANSGADLTVSIDQGKPNSTALLILGIGRSNVPVGFGCHLYVTPALGPYGPFLLDANGAFSLFPTLPPIPSLVTVTAQAFIADAGVPGGFSDSNGVEMSLVP